jgi:exoribonuclease-2
MRRSQMRASAEPHAGLGLEMYSQATSPLRRYLDLVLHQQLRAWVRGAELLDVEAMLQRVGEIDFMIGSVRRAERQSNLHWTLVYLLQNPGWEGDAVVVEPGSRTTTVILPDLGHENRLQLPGRPARNDMVRVRCAEVDLPALRARFRPA